MSFTKKSFQLHNNTDWKEYYTEIQENINLHIKIQNPKEEYMSLTSLMKTLIQTGQYATPMSKPNNLFAVKGRAKLNGNIR